jgi:hypothetical protein
MRDTTLTQPRPTLEHPLLVIERILRDREGIWRQISSEYRLNALIGQMLGSSCIALACYGIVLGSSSGILQAISSAIKLPILFLLTLAICLPTLYLFNLVFGARLSIQQAMALVLTAITVTSMLTLAFAPISLFFWITAPDYDFFKLLNVAILTLTGTVGLSFLLSGMRRMNALNAPAIIAPIVSPEDAEAEKPQRVEPQRVEQPVNMSLLNLWVVLYGFVGTQLAWTLRPFFGDPGMPFEIFRSINSNFYINIIHSIMKALT